MNNKLPFPRVVRIEPSAICNLKCRHCPTGTVDMKRGLMSEETFNLVIKNIEENIDNIKVVVLYNGGEPFLNKNFLSMLKKIKSLKKPPFVKVTSNGMLLNDGLIEGIIENQLDNIYFSIDGQNPEENNFIRRNSDYYVIVKNIKKLINAKKQFNSLLPKIMVSNVQFVEELDKTTKVNQDFSAPVPEFLLKEFNKELQNKEIEFQSLYPLVWPDLKIDYDIFKIKEIPSKALNYCDDIINTMTIRWNGDLTPCCFDLTSKCILGNIYENKLSYIWNSDNYINLRQSINETKFNELCKDCIYVCDNKKIILKNNS